MWTNEETICGYLKKNNNVGLLANFNIFSDINFL